MEWFFDDTLSYETSTLLINGEEYKHIKAHRIKNSEKVIITNGRGIAAECRLESFKKDSCIAEIIQFIVDEKKTTPNTTLAFPILDSRERFEFAFEKAIELGITSFIPLITDYSSKKTPNKIRLKAKAISAIKQCQRAALPNINNPMALAELIESIPTYQKIIIADIEGEKPKKENRYSDILLIVGPEGGLSESELAMLKSKTNSTFWNLGNSRLRAETAAIVLLGLLLF